jgi:hypothetical protein
VQKIVRKKIARKHTQPKQGNFSPPPSNPPKAAPQGSTINIGLFLLAKLAEKRNKKENNLKN